MRGLGEGCQEGLSLVTPLEVLLLKVRQLPVEWFLVKEDTRNTETEKLALAEKLVTTGKNGQRCQEMAGKARNNTSLGGAKGPCMS